MLAEYLLCVQIILYNLFLCKYERKNSSLKLSTLKVPTLCSVAKKELKQMKYITLYIWKNIFSVSWETAAT